MKDHKVINFIQKYATNPITGSGLKLLDWQVDLINKMYTKEGKLKPNGQKNVYLIGAKKTCKTSTASLLLGFRMFHNVNETYAIMSNSENQSLLHTKSFLDLFSKSTLIQDLKVYKNEIIHKNNNTLIKILPRTLSSVHGIQLLSVLVCDEIFEYSDKHFAQMDALLASQILAKDSQRFYLSNVPQYQDHKSLEILKHCKEDSSFYVKTFKANTKDWKSDQAAKEANPMWSIYPHVQQQYKQDLKLAKNDKDAEVRYKRFNLGLGCSLDDQRAFNPNNLQWMPLEIDQKRILKERDNYQFACGFDLALSGSDSLSYIIACKSKPSNNVDDYDSPLYILDYNIVYGNIRHKQDLIKQKIYKWSKSKEVIYQNKETIDHLAVLKEFYKFFDNNNQDLISQAMCVFDPAFSNPYRQELREQGFKTLTRNYSPKFMTEPIQRLRRLVEQKNVYIFGKENEAVKWQVGNAVLGSKTSRNYVSIGRLNNNVQLNVDFVSALLLCFSQLLKPRRLHIAMAI